MFVIWSLGRRFGPGFLWQSKHQLIESGWSWRTTSI